MGERGARVMERGREQRQEIQIDWDRERKRAEKIKMNIIISRNDNSNIHENLLLMDFSYDLNGTFNSKNCYQLSDIFFIL